MKRPKSMKWNCRLNGLEHVYLSTQLFDPDSPYPYGDAPILLSIKDWWISIEQAQRVHSWLGSAIKYAKDSKRKSRQLLAKRKKEK